MGDFILRHPFFIIGTVIALGMAIYRMLYF